MSPDIILALLVVLVAGLMRGFAGVGSGMLMAPFFIRWFGPLDTVVIIILLELVVTAQLMPSVYRHISWKIIAPMGLSAMMLMPVGNYLLYAIDPETLGRAVALLVTAFTIVLIAGWRYTGSRPMTITLGVGGISGLLLALTSLGNPPVILYLLSSTDSATTNRANFTGYFALTVSALVVGMLLTGQVSAMSVKTVAMLLPVFMFCVWIGSRLFRKSSEQLYRRVALTLLLCAGLYGLVA